MPGMIYADPRQRSPWETLLPQILSQVIIAKLGQGMEDEALKSKLTLGGDYTPVAPKEGAEAAFTYKGKPYYLKPTKFGIKDFDGTKALVGTKGGQEVSASVITPQKKTLLDYGLMKSGDSIFQLTPTPQGGITANVIGTKEKITTDITNYEKAKAGGYKGSFNKWYTDVKKAGASQVNIGQEKFGIQKMQTASETRTALLENKSDKEFYNANVPIFNTTNTRNEIAYWGTEKGKIYGTNEVTKIMKLPPNAIKAGWTPQRIQIAADAEGITIKNFLEKYLKLEIE